MSRIDRKQFCAYWKFQGRCESKGRRKQKKDEKDNNEKEYNEKQWIRRKNKKRPRETIYERTQLRRK